MICIYRSHYSLCCAGTICKDAVVPVDEDTFPLIAGVAILNHDYVACTDITMEDICFPESIVVTWEKGR